jgi:hypothetical protein
MYNALAILLAINTSMALPIEFHDTLNPKIWENEDEMRVDVQVTLLKSAMAFLKFIDIPELKIEGVRLTGSNASYNYTKYSDCDVHIIIDFNNTPCSELAENFFMTKKTLWNQLHEKVSVNGYKVEVYPEDITNPVHAAGVYDLLNGKWLSKPTKEDDDFDEQAVKVKFEHMADEIKSVAATSNQQEIDDMFTRLRDMRKAGLDKAGELSVENLVFKTLRNLGYIEILSNARLSAQDDDLSLGKECPICEMPEGGFDRCTVQTVNAFADFYHFPKITRENEIPLTGVGVVQALQKHGLKMEMDYSSIGKSVSQFVPTHRIGTWYISTNGHAMALINGQLIDAENKGPDGRRIVAAIQFKK